MTKDRPTTSARRLASSFSRMRGGSAPTNARAVMAQADLTASKNWRSKRAPASPRSTSRISLEESRPPSLSSKLGLGLRNPPRAYDAYSSASS
eukprot:jgi/Pico_ML_1/54801/g664.t1